MFESFYLFFAVVFYYYTVIRVSKIQIQLNVLIPYFTITVIMVYLSYFFVRPISFFVLVLCVFFYVKQNIKSYIYSAVSCLLSFIIIVIGDYVFSFTIMLALGISYETVFQYRSDVRIMPIAIAIVLSVIYILTSTIDFIRDKYYLNIKENREDKYIYMIVSLLFITALGFYVKINFGRNMLEELLFDGVVIFVYFTIFVILSLVILRLYFRELKQENEKIQMKQLQEYMNQLEENSRYLRSFRHDYVNVIASLRGYIDDNDMEGLRSFFFASLINENEKMESNKMEVNKLVNINLPELKGLVSSKILLADSLGVEMQVDIRQEIHEINISKLDLVRIVGIMFDNAIDATKDCRHKFIKFGIIKNRESIMIIIGNTFKGELPPIYKMFEEGYSTKGNGRGLGLYNLQKMIDQEECLLLETEIEGDVFIHILTIKN